jgi:hypothetical protein
VEKNVKIYRYIKIYKYIYATMCETIKVPERGEDHDQPQQGRAERLFGGVVAKNQPHDTCVAKLG